MTGGLSMVVRRGLSQLTANVGGNQSSRQWSAPVTEMLPSSVNKRPVSSKRNKQTGPRRIVLRTSPNGVQSGNSSKHKWITTGPLLLLTEPPTEAPRTLQSVESSSNSSQTQM